MLVQFKLPENSWFTYYGLDPFNGNKPSHCDASGTVYPNIPSENSNDSISFLVSSDPMPFPMLNAGRLYISIGRPLSFTVDLIGNPIPPRPADSTDPNYDILWDFFEVTYIPIDDDGLLNFNLSNVQSAGLPLSFYSSGLEPSTRQPVDYSRGWAIGGYSKFLTSIHDNIYFGDLILPGSSRVLAPGTAITAFTQKVIPTPLFSSNYLDNYIAQVWDKFKDVDLTFIGDPPPNSNNFVNWIGCVHDGHFTFVTNDLDLEPIVLSQPTTADLFENNFLFCISGKGEPGSLQENYANQLFGTLCAAFNRSVMLTTTTLANSPDCEWCKSKDAFYKDETTNHYSKEIHANCLDGLAYAFQSDDHCDVSSYISLINPELLTIFWSDVNDL